MCPFCTDQKLISPVSQSGEVFFSETSPTSCPHPTGSSIFVYSPLSSNLKHSRSWSTISPQGRRLRSSRGLSSVEEGGERTDRGVEKLSSASLENITFHKRTRPTKDPRELSSPKKTGETLSKAKEQHHSPKKTESEALEVKPRRSRTSLTQSPPSASPGKHPQAGQQAASSRQRVEHQQGPQRKEFMSRENLDYERKNSKGANPDIRTVPQGRAVGLERTTKDGSKKRAEGESHPRRTATGKDPGQDRNVSKETNTKKDTLSSSNDVSQTKDPVGEDRFTFSKEPVSQVASLHSVPESQQSPKGPISPGEWKLPSSGRILSQAEVLRDPM